MHNRNDKTTSTAQLTRAHLFRLPQKQHKTYLYTYVCVYIRFRAHKTRDFMSEPCVTAHSAHCGNSITLYVTPPIHPSIYSSIVYIVCICLPLSWSSMEIVLYNFLARYLQPSCIGCSFVACAINTYGWVIKLNQDRRTSRHTPIVIPPQLPRRDCGAARPSVQHTSPVND